MKTVPVELLTVMPLLKGRHYAIQPGVAHRDLDAQPQSPRIFYGHDHPQTFSFAPDDLGVSLDELHAAALANLGRRPVSVWVRIPIAGDLAVVASCDDFFAAERLLLPAQLRSAHMILATRELVAAIPHRGLLLATRPFRTTEERAAFSALVQQRFASGVDEPIASHLFRVVDGQLDGRDGVADPTRATTPVAAPAPARLVQRAVGDPATGLVSVVVGVCGGTADQLQRAIPDAVDTVLRSWLHQPTFSGRIQFELDAPIGLAVQRLETELRGDLARMTTSSGRPIRLELTTTE